MVKNNPRSTLSKMGDRLRPEILTARIFHSYSSVYACDEIYDRYVRPCPSQYLHICEVYYIQEIRKNRGTDIREQLALWKTGS